MTEKDKPEKEKQYSSAQDYQVLEDIEHIRKRPGNYIGSTDEQGWHHLFQEVIDNSIDEAVAGHCDQIKVILSPDQRTITVEDNGHGVPIETMEGRSLEVSSQPTISVLATLFLSLKSGGKFDNKIYKTSGGLHGIGVTAVNALSQELKVWNKRQGKTEILVFSRGLLQSAQVIASPQETDGVIVTFTPDPEIFREFTHFKIDIIQNRLRELAYLNSNLTLIFSTSPEAEPTTYHFSSGLTGWVKEVNQEYYLENTEICAEEWTSSSKEEYFHGSFAWQYNHKHRKSQIKSFCNNISTGGGGTHAEGFENGLTSTCREWIKEKYPGLKVNILKEDVLEGLTAIIAVRMPEPEFAGQTKDRLANKKVREIVKNATSGLVQRFFQDHGATAENIARKIIDTAQIRVKTEEHQELLREGRQTSVSPGKLADCISKKVEENEIFLVEGESAGGSAKLARDRNIQAVLALKGKIINVEKSERIKISKNEEIKNLTNALGFSINEATQNYYNRFQKKLETTFHPEESQITNDFAYEDEQGQRQEIKAYQFLTFEQLKIIVEKTRGNLLKKLRYGKIVIMTDADADGKHIECLALAFFARYFRYLIEEHRLFLAVPPLYKVQSKKEVKYLYNDQELADYQQEKVKGYTIQRFKGLGEMNPPQLRETTMALRRRCLHELLYSSPPNIRQIIEEMMGPKSLYRKQRLESGEHKHAQVIVKEVRENEQVKQQVEIDQALLVKFLTYAYEVVEDRALPQLHDGLKPVQRRILYTLYELNLWPNKAHRKSSKVAGDVTGNYHPHGTESVYQAMVKMTQDFNYRYPLVDGQGNWGSIDGDPAAAYRYTEARLSYFGLYLLEDLAFETVEWIDNYDETRKEPKILPANLNLLLNGSSGIAVGMSTNIPPHNLGEITEMAINLINQPDSSTSELINKWKCLACQEKGWGVVNQCPHCQNDNLETSLIGPDFPGGGVILEKEKLLSLYETGEGTIYIRGKTEIISSKQEKEKKDLIHITELPFKINKAKLVERISQLIKDKKIEGLRSVADYSNWEDRVNIHLKFDPNYDGTVILNKLYRSTPLQSAFSVKMRALIDDQPKIFPLKEVLHGFIEKRLENIHKKAQFLYRKNQKELINLETRRFIIEHYQEIAAIARQFSSEEERNQNLKTHFQEELKNLQNRLQEIQGQLAEEGEKPSDLEQEVINRILDTPASFRQFTPERREKLQNDITNLHQESAELQTLITDEERKKQRLIEELRELQKNHAPDQRRTKFSDENHTIEERELIPYEERIILLSRGENKKENKINNYLTIHSVTELEPTNIPSQGKELKTRGENWAIAKINRRDELWCFSNYGKLYIIDFYQFSAVNKVINLNEEYFVRKSQEKLVPTLRANEFFTWVLPVKEKFPEKLLLVITKKGKIKCWEIEKLPKVGKSGKKLVNLYQKGKCSLHQTQSEQHKTATCCDKSQGVMAYARCPQFRELQQAIRNCQNCQNTWLGGDDQIAQTALINESDEVEIILKRKTRDGQTKNHKVSAFRKKRVSYCPAHQTQSEQHKTATCCDKSQGVMAYARCPQFRELQKEIKGCLTCQSPELFTKNFRSQVKSEQVISLLIISPDLKKENLGLLLVKKDNSCRKKSWVSLKSELGKDTKTKKTKYCQNHWNKLSKTQEEVKKLAIEIREKKENLRKDILNSPLENEVKKALLITGQITITKETKEKIAKAPSEVMNEQARQNYQTDLQKQADNYQLLSNKILEKQVKLSKVKGDIKQCQICRGYCEKHQKQQIQHKTTPHQCSFSCPQSRQLQKQVKNCENCRKLRDQRHSAITANPLLHVCLFDKGQSPEIYLLSHEAVCWYNKKDLISFLVGEENRTRKLLDEKKVITDIKLYPR